MTEEDMTTNEKIAQLLQEQTYDERMEMAAWLSNTASDAKADSTEMDADWFASALKYWATNELGDEI
jgi:hypothetical protein